MQFMLETDLWGRAPFRAELRRKSTHYKSISFRNSAYEDFIVDPRNIRYVIHIILILPLSYQEIWMQMTQLLDKWCSWNILEIVVLRFYLNKC